ncbi:DNA ligase [Ramlibacter henchirensis]|uniref:DNA ligase n=1 Tax=Ramlibacter henchirensis TaxID=204072 RepID=A0A4Z0BSN6_9BURK|nr:DNA ligase [Ramlibacter henchirensis]
MSRREAIALLAAAACLRAGEAQAGPPALMLAQPYEPGVDLAQFGVSEKYDGLRGYWDGQALWTRGGEPVVAPPWFTAGWPAQPLDGELWAGRGRFESAVGTARTRTPDAAAWRRMRYMVFDLPAHPGTFRERHRALGALPFGGGERLQLVQQATLGDPAALRARLERTVRDGGEGLMLHRWDSLYRPGRSPDLLKYKTSLDADARVLGHLPGNGRHEGVLGALLVESAEGVRFRLGSGFSDAQRQRPPSVGSWVTYRYRGLTEAGVPRFPTFLRARPDLGS